VESRRATESDNDRLHADEPMTDSEKQQRAYSAETTEAYVSVAVNCHTLRNIFPQLTMLAVSHVSLMTSQIRSHTEYVTPTTGIVKKYSREMFRQFSLQSF